MQLTIILLLGSCSTNILGLNRLSKEIRHFSNTFDNFFQSADFKISDDGAYSEEPNKLNIVYRMVEEPIRIEKTVPVPFVKHVPHPVPVYVPQPYPVEKKVYVPYKVYEKQHVPVIYHYPVEKIVHVPVQVAVDPKILVPHHNSIDKRVATQHEENPHTYLVSNHKPFPTNHSSLFSKLYNSDKVKFPGKVVENNRNAQYDKSFEKSVGNMPIGENMVPSPMPGLHPFTVEDVIPYGARITPALSERQIEREEAHSPKESVQSSVLINKPDSYNIPASTEHTTKAVDEGLASQNAASKHSQINKQEVQIESSSEEKKIIIFPTDRNNTDDKT